MIYRLICIATLLSGSIASAQDSLTLDIAIEQALMNNYAIRIERNNNEIATNNQTRGNAGFLPEVTAGFNKTYGIQSYEQVRTTGEVRDSTGVKYNRQSYGVTLNWTVFDGMRMFTTYDQLELMNEQSRDNLRARIELLVYQVTSTFYQAALENVRLELFNSNIALSEQRLGIAKDKYDLGKASKLEYLQAQVDLNADKSAKIQQLEILAQRYFDLQQLMVAQDDSISQFINYTLVIDSTLNLNELLTTAENQNPTLIALRKQQLITDYETKIIEGERLPELSVFADYSKASSETPAGFLLENTSSDITYGVSASWTIFNGFNVRRRIQNAKILQQNASLQLEDQLLILKTDIKRLYLNYQNNLDLLHLEKENMAVAKENYSIAQDRNEIGLSNALELREAQINLINAELRYQNAAFAAKQAEVELKYLAGMLVSPGR